MRKPERGGAKINQEIYKLIQFADDTTILMTSIDELDAANSAILKWCEATGMRENLKKGKVWQWASTGP